jgi:hypothetical protein
MGLYQLTATGELPHANCLGRDEFVGVRHSPKAGKPLVLANMERARWPARYSIAKPKRIGPAILSQSDAAMTMEWVSDPALNATLSVAAPTATSA